jgi:hypothetical protein
MSSQSEPPAPFLTPAKKQRGIGRPPAKDSSPDYAQMTLYVRTNLRRALKIRLFEEGLEMSALGERLLIAWLATQEGNR